MNLGKFVVYSTAGAFLWSMILVQGGVILGDNWVEIRETLEPFDLAIAIASS
jgi:membrane protein DedA with SNARE-associated domain